MYKLEHGDYAYYNKKQLRFMTHHVSILIQLDGDNAWVNSHGEPHKVFIKYEAESRAIEQMKLDIKLIIVTGRFPVDELNALISGESNALKQLIGNQNGNRKQRNT